MVKPCGIDDREKEIAQFPGRSFTIVLAQLGFEFVQFLPYFNPNVGFVFPVKPHATRLVLDAVGFDKRRQRLGDTREHTLVAIFLVLLAHFPCRSHLLGGSGFDGRITIHLLFIIHHLPIGIDAHIRIGDIPFSFVPIDEVVSEHQFVTLRIAHICYVKPAFFTSEHGIEHNMLQNVAQLFANVLVVFVHQGIAEFEHLFDSIRPQALVGLLSVPRAFLAQPILYVKQTPEGPQFFFFRVHRVICLSVAKVRK